jgi:hypothetical protein
MDFKQYLAKNLDDIKVPKKIITKETKKKIVEKVVTKVVTKTINKEVSSYSDSELLEEINKRKINEQIIKAKSMSDPLYHASAILDDCGEFGEDSPKQDFNNQDDMMQHALGLF